MGTKVELKMPAAVEMADRAVELARVWVADGAQHVSLATGVWKDPGAWGVALVDLAHHIARAYEQTQGVPTAEALERIRAAFDAEWADPTDLPKGGLVD